MVRYLSVCLLLAFTSLSLAAPAPAFQSSLNAFCGSEATKVDRELPDVVDAISWVRTHADAYGIDRSGIALEGHGARAHLGCLVERDGRHLQRQGLSLSDLRAVVAIDSASYDIPRVHKKLGPFIERRHHQLVFAKRLIDAKENTVMIPGNTKTNQSIDLELGVLADLSTSALMAFLRAST